MTPIHISSAERGGKKPEIIKKKGAWKGEGPIGYLVRANPRKGWFGVLKKGREVS